MVNLTFGTCLPYVYQYLDIVAEWGSAVASGTPVKFVEPRPYADLEAAARKSGRDRERDPAGAEQPHLYRACQRTVPEWAGGSADEFRAGLDRSIAKGWLVRHESGT
jgi:hypothetical protein